MADETPPAERDIENWSKEKAKRGYQQMVLREFLMQDTQMVMDGTEAEV